MKFDELEKQLAGCQTLDDLFILWKEAHSCEENYQETTVTEPLIKYDKETNQTIAYPGIDKNSFIKDGYIEEAEYKSSNIKILFVLKEANIQAYRSDEMLEKPSENSQIGFYTDYIYSRRDVLNRPRQQEKLGRVAHYILYRKDTEDINKIKQSLKKCAFMNLNKRGGNNIEKKVQAYSEKYCPYICRQVELLNPDVIVIIGKTINEKLFVPRNTLSIKLNHTADWRHGTYKTENYTKKFIERFNAEIQTGGFAENQ